MLSKWTAFWMHLCGGISGTASYRAFNPRVLTLNYLPGKYQVPQYTALHKAHGDQEAGLFATTASSRTPRNLCDGLCNQHMLHNHLIDVAFCCNLNHANYCIDYDIDGE